MEGWRGKPDAKFIYQAKLYTDSAINSKDPKIVHMLFIQVSCVHSVRLPGVCNHYYNCLH